MNILEKNSPLLRRKVKAIPFKKITLPETRKLLSDMHTALSREPDGVALAAPQVGQSIRLFIVSPKVFLLSKAGSDEKKTVAPVPKKDKLADKLVYINPTVVKHSRKKAVMDEGCLSIRNYYGKVRRSEKTTITAYDEHGKKFTRGASGLLAQIFQHEMDHLEGILFSDKTETLYYVPPENRKKRDEL